MCTTRLAILALAGLMCGCASNDDDRYDRLGRAKEYDQDVRVNQNRYELKQNSPAAGQRLQGPPPLK